MKRLIIYNSKHGATRRYAEWILEKVKADIVELKNVDKKLLLGYDKILVATPIYAGNMKGAEFIKENWNSIINKKLAILTVSGHNPDSKETLGAYKKALDKPIRDNIKDFHVQGKIDFNDYNIFLRFLLKMSKIKEVNAMRRDNIKPVIDFMK